MLPMCQVRQVDSTIPHKRNLPKVFIILWVIDENLLNQTKEHNSL